MSVANLLNHASALGSRHAAYSAGGRTVQLSDHSSVGARLTWTLFALSFIALSVSGYLAMVAFTSGSVAGCGSGSVFDCDHVLHSRWAKVLSVPVSVLAMATHIVLLTSLVSRPRTQSGERLRWGLISFAAFAAGGAALWFIGLQVFWLQHLCPYCLVAHVAGLIIAALVIWAQPIDRQTSKWAAGAACVSLAGLITMQSATEPPPTYTVVETPAVTAQVDDSEAVLFDAPVLFEAPVSAVQTSAQASQQPRLEDQSAAHPNPVQMFHEVMAVAMAVLNPATLVNAQVAAGSNANATAAPAAEASEQPTVTVLQNIKLNTAQWPIVGNPNAEMVFVELFDYTCPHCQKTHVAIDGAMQKYGDRLAVVVLPVPLNRQCNPSARSTHAMHREACELAKLAIALWTVDRDQFAAFHDYLFDAKPTFAAAQAKAMQMVDSQKLTQAMNGSIANEYIAKHVALYQKAGAGTVPKLLFPTTKIEGEVASPEALSQLIERHLGRRQ
ncbi:MAG: vitamin K epoxide reductase family protein [Planctomycetaceae bacterium]